MSASSVTSGREDGIPALKFSTGRPKEILLLSEESMIISSYNSIYNFTLSLQISQSFSQVQTPTAEPEPTPLAEPEPSGAVEPEALPPESAGTVQFEDEGEEQKLRGENGVLRLLQEGHFKGNADMRLREVFHKELTILGIATTPDETVEPGFGEEPIPPEEME